MVGSKRLAIAAGLFAAAALGAATFENFCVLSSAFANDCLAKCQAKENACRRNTKDSPACSSEMTRCLQGCRTQR